MKRAFLIFVLVLNSVVTFAQKGNIQNLDQKYGVKNVKLGTPLSSFKDLVLIQKAPIHIYRKKREDLRFGEVNAKSISYEFLNGKLATITVEIFKKDVSTFYDAFVLSYGDGVEQFFEYRWHGKKTDLSMVSFNRRTYDDRYYFKVSISNYFDESQLDRKNTANKVKNSL